MLESMREVGRLRVAYSVGDFGNAVIPCLQELPGALHSALQNVAINRNYRDLPKTGFEFGLILGQRVARVPVFAVALHSAE